MGMGKWSCLWASGLDKWLRQANHPYRMNVYGWFMSLMTHLAFNWHSIKTLTIKTLTIQTLRHVITASPDTQMLIMLPCCLRPSQY